MYVDRPKEKEYHIEMYDYCRKDAVGVYNLLKASPGAKVLLKDACRPYLLMVFMCMSDYHQKHECPYFRWEGSANAGTKDQCEEAKSKCYVIDGITLTTKSPLWNDWNKCISCILETKIKCNDLFTLTQYVFLF